MKNYLFTMGVLLIALLNGCHRNEHQQVNGYVEGLTIYLASPFYGVLQHLAVVRGQQIKKGQLLFKLDPNPQAINYQEVQAQLEQAHHTLVDIKKPKRPQEIEAIKAQIEQALARAILAQIRVNRYEKLLTREATAKDTLDAAQATLKQEENIKLEYEANLALAKLGNREDQIKAQQAQVKSLIAKLDEARWELAQKTIFAPASGIVFDTYYRQGEYVAAQQPILSLLTPENIYIEFFVPLTYLSRLKVGQKITFTCEGCLKDNLASITYVSPNAEFLPPLVYSRDNSSKLVFRIKARANNPTQFKPGQPVVITL
jgi:HlyD family secretion protein